MISYQRYGVPKPVRQDSGINGGNYHCFNVVGDCIFDLTSEQFGDEILDYSVCTKKSRDRHFANEEKRKRYEYLKAKVMEAMKA